MNVQHTHKHKTGNSAQRYAFVTSLPLSKTILTTLLLFGWLFFDCVIAKVVNRRRYQKYHQHYYQEAERHKTDTLQPVVQNRYKVLRRLLKVSSSTLLHLLYNTNTTTNTLNVIHETRSINTGTGSYSYSTNLLVTIPNPQKALPLILNVFGRVFYFHHRILYLAKVSIDSNIRLRLKAILSWQEQNSFPGQFQKSKLEYLKKTRKIATMTLIKHLHD